MSQETLNIHENFQASGLFLLAQNPLEIQQLTLEDIIKKLKGLPSISRFHFDNNFSKLLEKYTPPSSKTLNTVVVSPMCKLTTLEMEDFAKKNKLRPATIEELIQYALVDGNLDRINYLTTLSDQNKEWTSYTPSVSLDSDMFSFNIADLKFPWKRPASMLYVRA